MFTNDSRLLVVDDDRTNCQLVSKFLTDAGYRVDTACDGAAALKLVELHPYALAVLDYQMPHMDGVELYQQIIRRQPDVLGVFLTAFTTLDTVYPAIMSGIERVLAKPVHCDELVSLVESLVGEAKTRTA
jgi:DNA-binding response OmpR family regulator